jgi:eukaryotic-like serine/threonine-protein kinase
MARAVLKPGMVIDGFTLEDLRHKGGMADLWAVTHPDHIGRPLLMKVPKLAEGEDPAAIVSFEMEQMILPRLKGPHVPQVVAVGDFAVQPHIVLEDIAGETLLPKLASLPLPPDEVARIGAQLATALDSLHRQHVIHLDLKPSNVLFRPGGEAVLIDFGLSHHTRLPDLMAEQFRLPYGTAPYMAPEQVMGVRTYRRSDLFALGVLMYFFATAVRPFGDPQTLKGLKQRLWRDPLPPRRWRTDIPPWLQEVILRCLEPDPDKRYPTAAQVAFDLRNPGHVVLTTRAHRLRQDSWLAAWRRRLDPKTYEPAQKLATQSKLNSSAIVAVLVDLDRKNPKLADAMRVQLAFATTRSPEVRIALVNVMGQKVIGVDSAVAADGTNRHVARLASLRRWVAPLGLDDNRVTTHVLEAANPADAILDYVRTNHVDQIIMGARKESTQRNLFGSVSGQIAAHAPCTVTVVRQRDWEGEVAEAAGTTPAADRTRDADAPA